MHYRRPLHQHARKPAGKWRGQALAEYALIIAFVVLAIIGIVALTGPAVGNVFSNAVANLLYQTLTPYNTLNPQTLESYLTAVASYTPATRLPRTPINPPTETPLPTDTPDPAVSSTPTRTRTPTKTFTPSPTGPSPTPVDQQFQTGQFYPMNHVADVTNPNAAGKFWHYDTVNEPSRLRTRWQAQYYNTDSWSGGVVATDDIYTHLTFNWGVGSPRAGVNTDNFSIRYTAVDTDGTLAIPFTAGERWQFRVTGNHRARVTVDSTTVVDLTASGTDVIETKVGTYTASATGRLPVVLEYADTTGLASLELVINRVSDFGACKWALTSNQSRSPSLAWSDSEDSTFAKYGANASCTLRQRGWYDLTGLSDPRLIFWDRWKLANFDSLQVGVREYDNPTQNWRWYRIHRAIGSNFNWGRQIVSLTNFTPLFDDANIGPQLGATPDPSIETEVGGFLNEKVEIAFRVVSDSSDFADGWYLDEVGVFDWTEEQYPFPYEDPIDRTTSVKWINECNWRIVNDTVSGTRDVWTTSPAVNPSTEFGGAFCPLTLNGSVRIPTLAESSDLPLIEFDSRVKLSAGDEVRVQVGDATDPTLWSTPSAWDSLPVIGDTSGNPFVYQGPVLKNWETLKVDLSPYRGQRIYVRFLLTADTASSTVATDDGWWIDQVKIRLNTLDELPMPFIEPFDPVSVGRWQFNGWGLTTGADPVRGSPTALTDSPGGAQYLTTTNQIAYLLPAIRIINATRPVVSFYTRWQAPTASLFLDYSYDDGFTWKNGIASVQPASEGAENRAWERYEVDLLDRLTADGQTISTGGTGITRLLFRFRIVASGVPPTADGFYIDDMRVAEAPTTTITLNAANNYNSIDTMNLSTSLDNWYNGGRWTWQNNAGRPDDVGTLTGGLLDSPGGDYNNPQRSIIELIPSIDATQAFTDNKFPAIVFWTKYAMGTDHRYKVEVKQSGSTTWAEVWDSVATAGSVSNVGWHRIVIPVDSAWAQPFRVRLRLQAMDSTTPGDGINIDDFQIIGRDTWIDYGALPGGEPMTSAGKWLMEGDWKVPTTGITGTPLWGPAEVGVGDLASIFAVSVPAGTFGNSTATASWVGDYWHTNTPAYWPTPYGQAIDWTALVATTPTLAGVIGSSTLDFDSAQLPVPIGTVGWTVPGLAHDEWYAIRYRRRFTGSGGQYVFRLTATGGVELRVGGVLQAPDVTLPKPYVSASTPGSTAEAASRVYFYRVSVGGNTDVDVRFWHSTAALTGSPGIELAIAEQEPVAKTAAIDATYTHQTRTSLILNGYVTIPAGLTGYVTYRERWSLAQTDVAAAYYSTDRGTTWQLVESTKRETNSPDGNGLSTQDWQVTSYLIPNLTGSPRKVMLKWELDARVNTEVANGWLIDDVVFQAGASGPNDPPTSASLAFDTLANTPSANETPDVTDPDLPDDFFKVTVTAAPRRGTAVVTTVVGNTDTVRYTPDADWTGTETFGFKVADKENAEAPGPLFATVKVDPLFAAGFDIGDASSGSVGVIDSYNWIGGAGTASDSGGGSITTTVVTGSTGSLGTILSSGDSNKDAMLQDYVASSTLAVNVNVPNGVYMMSLFFVESETTAQTFDLFVAGDAGSEEADRTQVLNDFTLGGQGRWQEVGPFTIRTTHGALAIRTTGGIASLAGIKLYEGGMYTDFTSADISPRASSGIGATLPGTTSGSAASMTITAFGSDIWTNNDGFRYVYKAERGDLDVIVRVDSFDFSSNSWAKAGIMFRANTRPQSEHLFFAVTGQSDGNGLVVQRRDSAGSTSGTTGAGTRSLPVWLKVEKRGTVFTVYRSTDGTTWGTALTSYTHPSLSGTGSYLVGLALTSHNTGNDAVATFSNYQTIVR
jgi:Flp pilus assembly pilin Flp